MLDIEKCDELTTLLQISKTPTVLLVNNGDVVDGITGLANDSEINQFFSSLEKILKIKEKEHITQKLIEKIYDLHEAKNYSESNLLI